jgi:hypothetical protein
LLPSTKRRENPDQANVVAGFQTPAAFFGGKLVAVDLSPILRLSVALRLKRRNQAKALIELS